MKPFTFKHGADPWPEGATVLHVYAIPDLTRDTALATLVRDGREALRDFPVTPVRPEWLHITIDQVTGAFGRSVTTGQRDDLVAALTADLATGDCNNNLTDPATAEPLTVVAGSMLSCSSGAICDLAPDDGIADLHRRVRSGIREVCGPDACLYEWGVQHLTIGCV